MEDERAGISKFNASLKGSEAAAWMAQFEAWAKRRTPRDSSEEAFKLAAFPEVLGIEVLTAFVAREFGEWPAVRDWFSTLYARTPSRHLALGHLQAARQAPDQRVAMFATKYTVMVREAGQKFDDWAAHLKAALNRDLNLNHFDHAWREFVSALKLVSLFLEDEPNCLDLLLGLLHEARDFLFEVVLYRHESQKIKRTLP